MPSTQYFLFHRFNLRYGSQLRFCHEYCREVLRPVAVKRCSGPVIFLHALISRPMPQIVMFAGLESLGEYEALQDELVTNRDYLDGLDKWEEQQPDAVEFTETSLLRAASYSPANAAVESPIDEAQRVFDLRIYQAASHGNLRAMHERFGKPVLDVYHRLGIHPLFYAETEIGPQRPSLVYLTPFEGSIARETAWNAFNADPEWRQLNRDLTERLGPIDKTIEISVFKSTDYSPLK